MQQSVNGGAWMRGLIKLVFILCYVAFMWASIHKVAYFFGNFEAQNGVNAGSYALAGAFDVTALVTTIGVMFFRKSMPGYVQWILWIFIVGIVAYTFFINWEYDAHFQGMSLALQPTGATTPILDSSGVVHYVPVMQQNTTLLFLNPLLASGFTVFALIYSVVAEFFGTKPPTAEELQKRIDYLKSVESLHDQIKTMEEKNKKPGLITFAKEKVIEVKKAADEVKKAGNEQPQAQKVEVPAEVSAELLDEENGSQDGTVVEPLAEEETEESWKEDEEIDGSQDGRITDPEMEAVNVVKFRKSGTTTDTKNTQVVPQARKFSRRKPMTIAEVAAELGCTERWVTELRSNGTLEWADEEKKLITPSSVKMYLVNRQQKKKAITV